MGITSWEFEVAMETYGAERLPDCLGSKNCIFVPCFEVTGSKFFHSGTDYIVQSGKEVPREVMACTIIEAEEKHPKGYDFWFGEIYSIKGILTLVAMLENKYSKKLIEELINKTYKKLLDCPVIQKNVEFPFNKLNLPEMEKFYLLLEEHSNIVNPFGSCNFKFKFKEPIQYLDIVNVSVVQCNKIHYTSLVLSKKSYRAKFVDNNDKWYYDTMVPIKRNGNKSYVGINHYFLKGNNEHIIDEVICLDYEVKNDSYHYGHPDDIRLRISLKTGLAWEEHEKEKAKPVTEEQINIMISYLKISIKKIKNKIVSQMVNISV